MNSATIEATTSLPASSQARTVPQAGEWRLPVLVLTTAILGWIAFLATTHLRLEDALITYRYAGNLARGNGFVYNVGERVLGTTAPLQAMALAAIGWMTGTAAIPAASTVMMMLAGLGAAAMTYRAARGLGLPQPGALLVLAAFCAQPTTLWMTTGGMETPLVVCLMAAGLYALASRSHYVAASAAALLPIVRIDAAVWSVMTIAVILIRDRRKAAGPLTLAAAIVGPWWMFASMYFGTILPHTVIAKTAIRFTGGFTWGGHLTWLTSGWLSFVPAGPVVGPIIAAGLMTVGAVVLHRLAPSSLLVPGLVAYQVFFGLALLVGRAPHFPWYLIPVSWSALILGMAGMWSMLTWLSSAKLRVVAVAGLVAYAGLLAYRDRQTVIGWTVSQENERMRQQVGDWLRTRTPPESSVAMEAIGYQGFYSERRIIDLAGLVSPAVVAIHRQSASHGEAFSRILTELHPDYIVLRSFEVDRNRDFHDGSLFDTEAQRKTFASRYVEAERFSAARPEAWGDLAYVTVYARKPASD